MAPGCIAKGQQRGDWRQSITTDGGNFLQRSYLCEQYEKINGRYFAAFIDNHFDCLFAVLTKDVPKCS